MGKPHPMELRTPQALLLTAILVPLTLMDNVLKPMLMGRGLSTPTLVIFMGVIGGTLSYGLIGLFVGPVVLAVFYDLLVSWLQHDPDATTKI
ncbi:AI-2E family transporter [Paracoccus actinidiae]|uniref:AI-2E family transporter n=1 Tax=Paracoccus actinidiae TaxID=3064531 RepID=UPI0027D263CF|nr:AI-2E family transporter [Paracoccus sp. M09]